MSTAAPDEEIGGEGASGGDAAALAERLFASGALDKLAGHARAIVAAFAAAAAGAGPGAGRGPPGLTGAAAWRAALALLAAGSRGARRDAAERLREALAAIGEGGRPAKDREGLRALCWLLADGPGELPPGGGGGGTGAADNIFLAERLIDLRYLATDPVLLAPGARLRVRVELLQYLSPGMFGILWQEGSALPPASPGDAIGLLGECAGQWLGRVAGVHRAPPGTATLASIRSICAPAALALEVTPANERWIRRMLLPGMVADIHPPLLGALAEAPAALAGEIASEIGALVPCWPAELMPEALGAGLARDPRRWTATLIDVADRAGLLGELIWRAAALGRSPRLKQAAALYNAYVARLRSAPGSPIELRG
jgi:hypothetical protein